LLHISAAMVSLPTKDHMLYRFYDRTDALLYVGITMNFPGRMGSHQGGKPWWSQLHHMTAEHFDTRAEALAAETKAIREEKPLFNVAGNDMASDDAQLRLIRQWLLSSWHDLPRSIRDIVEEPARAEGRRELADQILEIATDNEVETCTAAAQASAERDGEDASCVAELRVRAARDLAHTAYLNQWTLSGAVDALVAALPDEQGERCVTGAHQDLERLMGDDYTDIDVSHSTVHRLTGEFHIQYLNTLPSHERPLWIRAATGLYPRASEFHVASAAGEMARNSKLRGLPPEAICGQATGQTLFCPEPAVYDVRFADCPYCKDRPGPCKGHRRWCDDHMHAAAADEDLRDRDGQALAIDRADRRSQTGSF